MTTELLCPSCITLPAVLVFALVVVFLLGLLICYPEKELHCSLQVANTGIPRVSGSWTCALESDYFNANSRERLRKTG